MPATIVRPSVAVLVQTDHAGWSEESTICAADLYGYRMQHVRELLEDERSGLSNAE